MPEARRKSCQDKFLWLHLCSGQAVVSRGTILIIQQSEGNLSGAPRILIMKNSTYPISINLSGTSHYTSGLKSQRIRFPLHLLDRSLVSIFCFYLPKVLFFDFL